MSSTQASLFATTPAQPARAPARRRSPDRPAAAPSKRRRVALVADLPRTHDVPGADMAREMRAFAALLIAATPEELAEIDAEHRAAGYGGDVVDDGGAIGSCAPGPEALGPRVTCSCGSVMLASQFAEHTRLASSPGWSLHGELLLERGLPWVAPVAEAA